MEKKLAKGEETRKVIVDTARKTFNEKGVSITLDTLAKEMGIPKGRITNHFATKEKLFLAILADYEQQLTQLRTTDQNSYETRTMTELVLLLSTAMDLQYEYRCAILFLAVLSPGQEEMRTKIHQGKARNTQIIKIRMAGMVKQGLLEKRILNDNEYELLVFVYLNTMTQWVIYFDMYDQDRGYETMKPIYIQSIIEHVYGPYLTAKGRKQWKAIDVRELIRPQGKSITNLQI